MLIPKTTDTINAMLTEMNRVKIYPVKIPHAAPIMADVIKFALMYLLISDIR